MQIFEQRKRDIKGDIITNCHRSILERFCSPRFTCDKIEVSNELSPFKPRSEFSESAVVLIMQIPFFVLNRVRLFECDDAAAFLHVIP